MSRSPLSATIMVSTTSSHNWRTAKSKRQQLALGKNNNNNTGGVGTGGASTSNNKMSDEGRKNNNNSDAEIKVMIGGLKEKHEQLLVFLKSELEDCKLEQEEVLSTGLMKLPKAVRNMSIQAFNAQHSCDLLSLLKSKDGVVVAGTGTAGTGTAGGVVSKKNMHMNMNEHANDIHNKDATKKRCFETPAPSRMRRVGWSAAPGTVLRTARRGEGIYSQNGSPLAATEPGTVIATICKKPRRGGLDNNNESSELASANSTANVEINVGEGHYISLNDPNGISELDASMKQTAASQLKVLQDQMASLMATLKG
mmetsp:Transcript_20453/g.22820  ORF Transcript_20453/g.22820 Transcript_20453/m.22820 type:complete len:311 (-) Transcript_20453:376-1308(-)